MAPVPSKLLNGYNTYMSDNCRVRLLKQEDLPLILTWRNHPDIRRFMFTQHEIQMDEHRKWFESASQDPTRRLLMVEDSMQAIGYVQFSRISEQGVADWGFFVRPESAKGTGRQLGEAALEYAFGTLNLHKVCGQAIDVNQASIAFHERLGFSREAELTARQCINGRYHDVICFGLLEQEWQAARNSK